MESLVDIAKAFSDKNRLKILTLIQREGSLCVCEICDTLGLSQPLVSRHLKQLAGANMLTASRSGKWKIYRIVSEPSGLLFSMLDELKQYEAFLPSLCVCKVR